MISKDGLILKRLTFQDALSVVLSVLVEMGVDLRAVSQGNTDDVPEFFRDAIAAKINCALIEINGEQADWIRFVGTSSHREYGAYCAAPHICEILKNSRVFFERPKDRFQVKLGECCYLSYANRDLERKKEPLIFTESNAVIENLREKARRLVLLNQILLDLLTEEQLSRYEYLWRAEFAATECIEGPMRQQVSKPREDEGEEQQPFDTNSDPDEDLSGDEWKKA